MTPSYLLSRERRAYITGPHDVYCRNGRHNHGKDQRPAHQHFFRLHSNSPLIIQKSIVRSPVTRRYHERVELLFVRLLVACILLVGSPPDRGRIMLVGLYLSPPPDACARFGYATSSVKTGSESVWLMNHEYHPSSSQMLTLGDPIVFALVMTL